MELSIVIVNYNVEHFLEQCLLSVRRALRGIDGEVFVVDNNSVDGSLKMLSEKFPEVKVFANKENVGFSRANNQAIRVSTGEFVLLLNPDTVVEDDTFTKVLSFMHSHAEAGGLGVRMLDGKGNFLPESKRGLPTPMTAFYKIFGLSKLFPRSHRFGRYHLGFLDENAINEVDVLSGAFMLLRREALDKAGLLDESFFMYGEDIDMSYRITKAGYKNYYFPETRIIHYKGESTKKTSVNYVIVFYRAMEIFARKHFSKQGGGLLSFFINLAIYLRASMAIFSRFLRLAALPFCEFVVNYIALATVSWYYGNEIIYNDVGTYPPILFQVVLPLYVLIWSISMFLTGAYDKPIRPFRPLFGTFIGTLVILVVYALLPEEMRFSRALILFGMVIMSICALLFRLPLLKKNKKNILIIGNPKEVVRVETLLKSTVIKPNLICRAIVDEQELPPDFVGTMRQVPEIVEIKKINEVIFCAESLSPKIIIDKMLEWQEFNLDYKIAPEDAISIIGSNSINTRGDLYTVEVNTINNPINKRNKRLFDIFISCALIISFIISAWFIKKPFVMLKNAFKVLFGRLSWIGYASENDKMPKIKKGVFSYLNIMNVNALDEKIVESLDIKYAKNYSLKNDLNIFFEAIKKY